MIVYIKDFEFAKNFDGFSDKFLFKKDVFIKNGFQEIFLNDDFKDCNYADFEKNEFGIFEFNEEKYTNRKQKEINALRIAEIKTRLAELSQGEF